MKSMSFEEFASSRAKSHDEWFCRELDRHIQAKKDHLYISSDSYHILITEIMAALQDIEKIPVDIMDKIYEFSDLVIMDMGEDIGRIHLSLRHTKHQRDNIDYNDHIQSNVCSVFNQNGHIIFTLGQFLTTDRNGDFCLNVWGELVLERMDEIQILALNIPAEHDFPQIYNLQHLARLEKGRLWQPPANTVS